MERRGAGRFPRWNLVANTWAPLNCPVGGEQAMVCAFLDNDASPVQDGRFLGSRWSPYVHMLKRREVVCAKQAADIITIELKLAHNGQSDDAHSGHVHGFDEPTHHVFHAGIRSERDMLY